MEGMEQLEVDANSFASSEIYRVCLPKSRNTVLVNKAKEDELLITHVMFEA